jgi:hypothetical protein
MNTEYDNDVKDDDEEPTYFYVAQAEMIKNTNSNTMYVDFRHLFDYDITYDMRELILNEFYRYK